MLSMERRKHKGINFSDCVFDLVHTLGFRPSKEQQDALSRVTSSNRTGMPVLPDTASDASSDAFSLTHHTESKYASLAIDEENKSLADRIMRAKEKSRGGPSDSTLTPNQSDRSRNK